MSCFTQLVNVRIDGLVIDTWHFIGRLPHIALALSGLASCVHREGLRARSLLGCTMPSLRPLPCPLQGIASHQ